MRDVQGFARTNVHPDECWDEAELGLDRDSAGCVGWIGCGGTCVAETSRDLSKECSLPKDLEIIRLEIQNLN